jgi:hypothetical protein
MTVARDEITHHVLRMADAGLCTRNYTATGGPQHGDATLAVQVNIDGRPAPDNAYWALTSLGNHGYITWSDLGIGTHIALTTPAGIAQLHAWDDELLGTPATSSRPLSCLDDYQLAAEVERLIDEAFPHSNETRERDER